MKGSRLPCRKTKQHPWKEMGKTKSRNDRGEEGLAGQCQHMDMKLDDSTRMVPVSESVVKNSFFRVSMVVLLLVGCFDCLREWVDVHSVSEECSAASDAGVSSQACSHNSMSNTSHGKHREAALGSSALSSLTTVMSPVLPFTGGVDLTREEYWQDGFFGSLGSVFEIVRDAFASNKQTLTTHVGGTHEGDTFLASRVLQRDRLLALSSPEPFVPMDRTAELTLADISEVFRFAMCQRKDSCSVNVNDMVLEEMLDAIVASRGRGVSAPTSNEVVADEVDALQFCAALRIFGDWRVIRQVPDGYKGYAMGMSLGQKDIIQNIAKIEGAVHRWLDHQDQQIGSFKAVTSPTLRDLLTFESENGIHENLPHLQDKTAAMGLLWVRRQLHYQVVLLANILQVPKKYKSAGDAITAAYQEVYDSYHGWAVQRLFAYSLQAVPDTSEVYKMMNPRMLDMVEDRAKALVFGVQEEVGTNPETKHHVQRLGRHVEGEWKKFVESNPGIRRPVVAIGRHFEREWKKLVCAPHSGECTPVQRFLHNVGSRWNKLATDVSLFFDEQGRPQAMEQNGKSSHADSTPNQQTIAHYVDIEMEKDAHKHIVAFLEVAQPLLDDLAQLFEELNMDDPTKV